MLIGNVVRQPEIRSASNGVPISTFHIITNREWETSSGERKTESTKHICIAWNRLAEICADMLTKGTLVYIEGRIQTKVEQDQNEYGRETIQTSIIVEEMVILNQKQDYEG